MTKWIKCSERLPENEFIAFVYDGKEILRDISMDRITKKWERETSMGFIVEVNGITHWMPEPQPPEEE